MTQRVKKTAINHIKSFGGIEIIPKEDRFRYKKALIILLNDLENLNLWDKLPPMVYTFNNKYFDHEKYPIILQGKKLLTLKSE